MSLDQKTTIPADYMGGAVVTVDEAHHEAHDGSAFVIVHSGTKNSTEYICITFTTPALATASIHMVVYASGSGVSTLEIGEGATASGGSGATVVNRNRNSSATTSLTGSAVDDAVSALGTTIYALGIGAGQNNGDEHRNDVEFILKASTKYALKLTSGAATNALRLIASWYEESR